MKGRWEFNINVWFPIYLFLEMKLLCPKQNYNVLSPSSYIHLSVRDLYISRIGLPILLQKICVPILGLYTVNLSPTHECGNWDWGRTVSRKGIHKWDIRCSADLFRMPCYACLPWEAWPLSSCRRCQCPEASRACAPREQWSPSCSNPRWSCRDENITSFLLCLLNII